MANKIEYAERKYTYEIAICKYGSRAQIMMAFEEMAELMKELCKNKRGRENRSEIAEEIADVTIMLEQLRLIFDVNEQVCDQMDKKIMRLQNRLGILRRSDWEEKAHE